MTAHIHHDKAIVEALLLQPEEQGSLLQDSNEELQANAEIMRSDSLAHADAYMLEQYAEDMLAVEYRRLVVRHLWNCAHCRGDLSELLSLDIEAASRSSYRELSEIQLRRKPGDLAVIKQRENDLFTVWIISTDMTTTATIPPFARRRPQIGDKVIVWTGKNGHSWLLAQEWEPARLVELPEETQDPMSRRERLEPAFKADDSSIREMLKHAAC